jgi:hypothetical protein
MTTSNRTFGPKPYGSTTEEKIVLDSMVAMREAGLSLQKIAKELDRAGAPTRLGGQWSSATVSEILKRHGITTPGPELVAPRVQASASAPDERVATDLIGRTADKAVCSCVYRRVCSDVIRRFRYAASGLHVGPHPINLDHVTSPGYGKHARWIQESDYVADVTLMARRTLDPDAYKLFRLYHVQGLDIRVCAQRLGIHSQECFRRVQDIEAQLGKAFKETLPYPLWPMRRYFDQYQPGGARPSCAVPAARIQERGPLRPPLAALPGLRCEANAPGWAARYPSFSDIAALDSALS